MPATKWFQHVIETPEPGQWELSGYEAAVPITEKSNPLTRDLDIADAEKIVRLLGQCDAEIFQEEGQALPTYQVTQTHVLDPANKHANPNPTSALPDGGS
uniref:glucokinase regulatory protein-like isoform X1 n=1 Tax=Callithrix jacchus TaxID=9483 RepID=UPI0023DD59BF|nr:glucokinase regulatory protein-like isoform X1 [Callithrix jacchus]